MNQNPIVPLKTIGILGGMSTEATREYYQLINAGVQQVLGGHNVAELLVCSVNFENITRFIKESRWDEAAAYLAQKARQIQQGGADYLFLATNTMHKVSDAITAAVSIPFVDIFAVTAEAVRTSGIRRVALLGTYPVMSDAFYQQAYKGRDIAVITPTEAEKREVDRIIFEEMCHHRFLPASKQFYIEAALRLREQGAEALILGCTEIKMLIQQEDLPGFPVFDTTTLHCQEAVRLCLGPLASGLSSLPT